MWSMSTIWNQWTVKIYLLMWCSEVISGCVLSFVNVWKNCVWQRNRVHAFHHRLAYQACFYSRFFINGNPFVTYTGGNLVLQTSKIFALILCVHKNIHVSTCTYICINGIAIYLTILCSSKSVFHIIPTDFQLTKPFSLNCQTYICSCF